MKITQTNLFVDTKLTTWKPKSSVEPASFEDIVDEETLIRKPLVF